MLTDVPARIGRGASAVKNKPAQLVAEPLVIEHELADLVGESGTLPPAFQTACLHAIGVDRRSARSLDGVRRCPEFVSSDVSHGRGLAGGVSSMPWSTTQISRRGVRMARRGASHSPADLAACPCTPEVDRSTWPVVVGPRLLEMVQHVLRAVSRPEREATVIVVLEDSAPTHRDEPWIPDLGKDHSMPHMALVWATVASA
jgi:hypothetical protein